MTHETSRRGTMPDILTADQIAARADELIHPQKVRAATAIAAIDKRIAELKASTPDHAHTVSSVGILSGEHEFDADEFAAAVAANWDRRQAVEELDQLAVLRTHVQRESRAHRGDSLSDAYTFLREQLDALVEAMRRLGPVPATADEAVGDPASAEAYGRGQALVGAYKALRAAQVTAWQAAGAWAPDVLPTYRETLTADSIRRDQVWLGRRQALANHRRARGRAMGEFLENIESPRFDTIQRGPGPFPEGVNEVAYLRWLATECVPHILTPKEALTLHKEWKDAINAGIVPDKANDGAIRYGF